MVAGMRANEPSTVALLGLGLLGRCSSPPRAWKSQERLIAFTLKALERAH